MVSFVVLLLNLFSLSSVILVDWSASDKILEAGVKQGAYPGAVALLSDRSRSVLHWTAVGEYTFGAPAPRNPGSDGPPPMSRTTRFDMASCTKVLATTTAVAQFYQRGELPLDTPVADLLGPAYSVGGKGPVTVLNCLLHNAGYGPDPVPFWSTDAFGCPETSRLPHPLENFSCMEQVYQSFLATKLVRPPDHKYVYSDLSFITLMFVVGAKALELGYVAEPESASGPGASASPLSDGHRFQAAFEAYVQQYVLAEAGMTASGYLPAPTDWSTCAPTANDTTYRHEVVQGQVQDPNTYAMGGISGHAGLFSTVDDVNRLMRLILFAPEASPFFNGTTSLLFTREYNHTQSSRALGWNTNDPTVFDRGWNNSCGSLSPRTFMHLGYTGTMVCADPDRGLILVMLTNRVYPSTSNTKIERVRQLYATAVQKAYDAGTLVSSQPPVELDQQQQSLLKINRGS